MNKSSRVFLAELHPMFDSCARKEIAERGRTPMGPHSPISYAASRAVRGINDGPAGPPSFLVIDPQISPIALIRQLHHSDLCNLRNLWVKSCQTSLISVPILIDSPRLLWPRSGTMSACSSATGP